MNWDEPWFSLMCNLAVSKSADGQMEVKEVAIPEMLKQIIKEMG